jgi:hypothetical protein
MTHGKRRFGMCEDCRAAFIQARWVNWKAFRALRSLVGHNVQYYLNGWHVGVLVLAKRTGVCIQPLAAIGGRKKHELSLVPSDVRPIPAA